MRKRLQIYADSTAPVIGYYKERGLLTVVDGVGELDEVTERLKKALKG